MVAGAPARLRLRTSYLRQGLSCWACYSPLGLFLAWSVLGVGMTLGLYDAAFEALTAIYGHRARGPITGITLIAGFASTIGWPLSALLNAHVGWRGTCFAWAALHLLIGFPMKLFLLPRGHRGFAEHPRFLATWEPRRDMMLLSYIFAASWFVTGAMAAHLPALLAKMGASPVEAVAASALVGPAQVGARLAEFFTLHRAHPLVSARIATCLHPIGAALLAMCGAPCGTFFAVFHGAGNGLLTIARGTLPLALFGPEGFGSRTGLIGAPSRMAQAAAPFLFGLLLDVLGREVILVSAGLCLSALGALVLLKQSNPPLIFSPPH
jgi:hypothetical protein